MHHGRSERLGSSMAIWKFVEYQTPEKPGLTGGCYDGLRGGMIPSPVLIEPRGSVGLSVDTLGKREELRFHRVRSTARLRRKPHAESDSLEHSAVVSNAESFAVQRTGQVSASW